LFYYQAVFEDRQQNQYSTIIDTKYLPRSCEPKDSSEENELQIKRFMLNKGSPIIIIDAPKAIKTQASSIPCPNFGLVKRGNVGRYMFCPIS
jgi:hypothetical protein